MTEKLIDYLGKPASILLKAVPFKSWSFSRSVDEDLPDHGVNYTSKQHGLSLACDYDERIHSIFLKSDRFDQDLLDIPFSSSRAEVLGFLGKPSKSAVSHTDPILGEYGAWDRFDGANYSIHIEFQPHADRIKMVTLMRADVVPGGTS